MTKAAELRELSSLLTANTTSVTFDSDIRIGGDLVTTGTTITVDANTLNITDPNITLASGSANSSVANGAGLTIDGANVTFNWDNANSRMALSTNLEVTGKVRSTRLDFNGSSGDDLVILNELSGGIQYYADNNGHTFNTYDGGWKDRLKILDGGNVGVGNENPSVMFEVGKSVSGETGLAIFNSEGGNQVGVHVKSRTNRATLQVSDNDTSAFVQAEDAYAIYGQHSSLSNADMTIDTTGNVNLQNGSYYVDQVRHSLRPTLNLDFANTKELDSRITFYRDSIATYYDSRGVLRYANTNEPRLNYVPATGESEGLLIESQRTNLIQYSTPTLAGWSPNEAYVVHNAEVAPDGTYSAVKLQDRDSASAVFHGMFRGGQSTTNGLVYTISGYFKKGTEDSVGFRLYNGAMVCRAIFNLATGTPNLINGTDAKMEDVGNGWYRCSITGTSTATYSSSDIYIFTTSVYTHVSNGDNSIYAWGIQFEQGTFASSYIPTDLRFSSRGSRASYYDESGVLRRVDSDEPRYGYKWDGRKWTETGLIYEPSSTNLFSNANDFSASAWSVGRQNIGISVDWTKINPDQSVPTRYMTSSSEAGAWILENTNLSSGALYTTSIYVRQKTANINFQIAPSTGFDATYQNFDLSTGQLGSGNLNSKQWATMEYVGNDWYRCSVTAEANSTLGRMAMAMVQNDNARLSTVPNAVSLDIWGAQMEQNSEPTSFIYTHDSAVSRSADVVVGSNYTREKDYAYMKLGDWYNNDSDENGTVYLDANASQAFEDGVRTTFFGISDSTDLGTTNCKLSFHTSSTAGRLWIRSDSSQQNADSNTGTRIRLASSYDDDTVITRYIDGSNTSKSFVDITAGNTSISKYLVFGEEVASDYQGNFTIKRFAYYPEALSANELTALIEE